ncbi:type I methionyl aminopeptidase [Malacoplasma muris]|uniref:type I methionyl aminopeptidase n=1 Tax=Malacoplasma muris TaxID=2119 RepID=UPI00398EE23A
MIIIKSLYDIEQIEKASSIWKKVRDDFFKYVTIGQSLKYLDLRAKNIIENNGGKCAFYKYNGFPGNICISVNDVIIHGIPNDYILQEKDIVTFDVGVDYNGYICDAAFTIVLGNNEEAKKINEICYNSLLEGIKQAIPNNYIGDISFAIQSYVEKNGYHVIHDFGGHGCGRKLHEDPMILNYGKPKTGAMLRPGMVICIEPMILTDDKKYYIDKKDKWSVISENHKLTCHWEHMILITKDGNKILTE